MNNFENFIRIQQYVINLNNVAFFRLDGNNNVVVIFDKDNSVLIQDAEFYKYLTTLQTENKDVENLFD